MFGNGGGARYSVPVAWDDEWPLERGEGLFVCPWYTIDHVKEVLVSEVADLICSKRRRLLWFRLDVA